MKNQWVLFFKGYVRIRIYGKGAERFLNEIVRRRVYVWNVKRVGEEVVECNVQLKDIAILRKVRKAYGCTFRFVGKRGFPFRLKSALFHNGFLLGIVGFLILIFALSNMVWGIEVKGATPQTEHLIEQELKKIGVKKGAFLFDLDDPETIQKKLTNTVPSITWVGVQLNGTTYEFQVVEKEEPVKEKELPPQHLVAKKEAVITKIYAENGKAVVKVHNYVKKGQILISGSIGKEDGKALVLVPATGVVIGETWYESSVEVPLQTDFQLYTGEQQKKHYLKIGNMKIKIWGFEKNIYKNTREESSLKKLKFLKWTLPIAYEEKTIREEETFNRTYTKKEAIEVGKEIAKKELKQKLGKDAMIKEENVLRQTVDNGKVKLRIYFVVEENIATEQVISQGDK